MTEAAALFQSARAAMARKDARAARQSLAHLLNLHPTHAEAWLTASILELDLNQPARALAAIETSLALEPENPTSRIQHIRCLHAAGKFAEATAALHEAERRVESHPHLQHELGNAAAAMEHHAHALRLMSAAQSKRPTDPALAYNLAAVQRFLGRFAEAETNLNLAIKRAPHDHEAYLARAQLRTQTPESNHLEELQQILDAGLPSWSAEIHIRYALAKEHEDLEDYENAFTHLHAGATLRRRHLHYDVADDIAAMDSIRTHFATPSATEPNPPTQGPIFIFGLPRSGTTLIDRILGSHPDITSLGELNDFPAAVIACAGAPNISKHDLIARAAATPSSEIAAAYLARVKQRHPASTPFIDKLPMNYLYAGLIAAALPNAQLIHVTRHPLANAYGMYKTLFNQGYPFSYDLDDLGRYIAAYLRLMSHWRAALAPRLITVAYESLVINPKQETRSLLAALNLPFHPACLSPERNPSPTSTQSAVQVRHPIHPNAIHQWRNVAHHLTPTKQRLLAEGVPEADLA